MIHKRIDSDTHVVESEATWADWKELGFASDPPVELVRPEDANGAHARRWWLFDGRVLPRQVFAPEKTLTSEGSRELTDIASRLADMESLQVGAQMVYPTLFIFRPTADPRLDRELCRCYNHWMEKAATAGRGKLHWAAVVPMADIPAAVAELEKVAAAGAAAINIRGFEVERIITDEYFYPVYEAAEALDIPLCIHSGNGSPHLDDTVFPRRPDTSYARNKLPVLAAFSSLAMSAVPRKYPGLRFGFIESGASWLPYIFSDLRTRYPRVLGADLGSPSEFLRERGWYVTCQMDEDLEYLVAQVGADNLLIGSDFGHADNSSELRALSLLAEDPRLDAGTKQKILWDNPRRLYGPALRAATGAYAADGSASADMAAVGAANGGPTT